MTAFTFLPQDFTWKFLDSGNSTDPEDILPATASAVESNIVSNDWRGNTSDADESPISALISLETLQTFEDITSYSTYLLVVLGTFLCLFSVVVYASKQMRSPNSIYMVALNLSELICVVILMFKEALILIYGEEVFTELVYIATIIYVETFAATATRRTTYCVSCLLTAERCIAVVLPLKVKLCRIVRYPLQTIIFIGILSVVYNSFILLKLKPLPFRSTSTNETLWTIGYTDIYVSDQTWYCVCGAIGQIVFVVIPLLGCLIFNLITIIALRRHTKTRKSITKDGHVSKRSGNDARTTTVVLVSTMVLVISALPANIVSTLIMVNPVLLKKYRRFLVLIWKIGKLCELFNSCLGFVFYMTLSSRFRKLFLELFYYKCKGTPGSGTDLTSSNTRETHLSAVSGPVTECAAN